MSDARVFLAVDAANLFYALSKGERVNYEAPLTFARHLGTVIEAAIYVPRNHHSEKEKGLLLALKFLGYTKVINRLLRYRPDGSKKSDIDVAITIDIWDAATRKEMDIVVLASGDGDFIPLVERLVSQDIDVHIVGPDGATAWELIVASTRFWHTHDIEGLIYNGIQEQVPLDLSIA